MRSDMIKVSVDKAYGLCMRGIVCDQKLNLPTWHAKAFIAICNSYIDIVPGHVHLRELADIAIFKEAIREGSRYSFWVRIPLVWIW